jgi:hypothetical protein
LRDFCWSKEESNEERDFIVSSLYCKESNLSVFMLDIVGINLIIPTSGLSLGVFEGRPSAVFIL